MRPAWLTELALDLLGLSHHETVSQKQTSKSSTANPVLVDDKTHIQLVELKVSHGLVAHHPRNTVAQLFMSGEVVSTLHGSSSSHYGFQMLTARKSFRLYGPICKMELMKT